MACNADIRRIAGDIEESYGYDPEEYDLVGAAMGILALYGNWSGYRAALDSWELDLDEVLGYFPAPAPQAL